MICLLTYIYYPLGLQKRRKNAENSQRKINFSKMRRMLIFPIVSVLFSYCQIVVIKYLSILIQVGLYHKRTFSSL